MSVDVRNAISTQIDAAHAIPLGQILAHHGASAPNAPALTIGDETLTFPELDARANRRARLLQALGVSQNDFVVVALANGVEFYETSFAIWKLGATPAIVSHRLADPELEAIVALADPSLIIGVPPDRAPGRTSITAGVVTSGFSDAALPDALAPYWKAMTSGGSTGRPKLIVDHMPGQYDPASTAAGQIVGDVVLNPGPLYHNAPFSCAHFGLFSGGHVVEMQRFDAERALALIEKHKVGWVNLVPTMMHRIISLPEAVRLAYDVSSLRVVFHMAAPCPVWLKHAWIDWLGPERIFELYGGTERQGATVISGTEWLERPGSVGKVQPGAQMRVLRDDGSECAPGEIGEIYFLPDAGRNASYHYVGAEPRSAGAWESLGDLGHVDADGYLYLSDRRSDLILVGGANVYPAEVEAALDSHPMVACAVVIGLPDSDLGQRVHAIIEPKLGTAPCAEEIIAHARERIAITKTPRSVEFVSGPLRDDAGKVRRAALREARLAATSQT